MSEIVSKTILQIKEGLKKREYSALEVTDAFISASESNKKLNVLIQTFKQDLDDLDKRFNKKKRDVGKIAIERTEAVERIFNKKQ